MIIDEGEEQTSIIEEKETKTIPTTTNLVTITSLIEKEISKTLNETEKRSSSNNNNIHSSPERPVNNNNNTTQPPPLITLTKSRSPAAPYKYPSHSQQQYLNTGSIMRGTPISSSTPTNKPINIDISSTHPHSHHYNNPRNEYLYLKSPKLLDRNMEQQQQQQQQHLLHQHMLLHICVNILIINNNNNNNNSSSSSSSNNNNISLQPIYRSTKC